MKIKYLYLLGEIEENCSLMSDVYELLSSDELPDRVTLIINSSGGDGICGIALYDALTELKNRIPDYSTKINGSCHSAAVLPFLSADRRTMTKNSYFMAHNGTISSCSTAEAMKYAYEFCLEIDKLHNRILREKTRLTDVTQIFEWFLGYEKCKKYGIITEE